MNLKGFLKILKNNENMKFFLNSPNISSLDKYNPKALQLIHVYGFPDLN